MVNYNKVEQDKLVSLLEKKTEKRSIHGLDMVIKHIPDLDIEGSFDPRVKEAMEKAAKQVHDLPKFENMSIEQMRAGMGYPNLDISNGITTGDKVIQGRNGDILLKVYSSNKSEAMPAIVFIHGGAFFGGSTRTVENPCKYLAERIEGVVVSVDYRLCPEHKFPQGFHDCFDAVKWLYENSKELNLDCEKIGVSGDSAGGNLSTVCALMDRDIGTKMIKFQALLYPGLYLSEQKVEDYEFDISLYNVKQDNDLINNAITMIKKFPPLSLIYVNDQKEVDEPYVSPLLAKNLKGMPTTLIVTSEYDYLTLEAESYARKLIRNGVQTKIIRYNGIDHGFIDKIGVYPQAQDCFNEIAKAFKETII
jgi:acetyl esterase